MRNARISPIQQWTVLTTLQLRVEFKAHFKTAMPLLYKDTSVLNLSS